MPKKKLLVILGAGSSISQRMPSVACLDRQMTGWSETWKAQRGFPNYFQKLWDSVDRYYQAPKTGLRPQVNFEKVLGDMVALAHWMVPPPHGDTLREIACGGKEPPDLDFPCPHNFGPTVTIVDQLTYLLCRLAKHMRELCRAIDTTAPYFQSYKRLIGALVGRFDVGIYNLNYDNVAHAAWPEAFLGFGADAARSQCGSVFDPVAVHTRREWSFLYHLHGSVHHTLVNQSIRWQRDLTGKFFDVHQGLLSDRSSEEKDLLKTTLVAGDFKLDQLLTEPFQSFYATLVRHVYEADAVLIGGYGFGDAHVNRVLQNRLKQLDPDKRPPVMVLTRSESNHPMKTRDDRWSRFLCTALATNGWFFPGIPSISDLLERREFEVSLSHRVAIWHGGFVEAVDRLDAILPWLEGQANDSTLAAQ